MSSIKTETFTGKENMKVWYKFEYENIMHWEVTGYILYCNLIWN